MTTYSCDRCRVIVAGPLERANETLVARQGRLVCRNVTACNGRLALSRSLDRIIPRRRRRSRLS